MNPQYRAAAQECIGLARRSADVSERLILLSLARAWVRLSEQADTIDGFEGSPDQKVGSVT
jgi:hypothetical protein